jgi:glucokinase
VIGEANYGAARGHQDVIYITLSTGIGGGLFLNGKLYRGSSGFAGEIGHTKPFGKGRKCNCGGDNCLEAWASGGGIAESAATLWEPADLNLDELTTASVFAEAATGNQPAEMIVKQAIYAVGTGLANLVNILNPSCVVFGGGIINAHPDLITELEKVMLQNAIRPAAEISAVKVVQTALAEDSGLWGIYALLRAKE